MKDDDAALLAAIRDGSERAFNLLIDRHQQAVRTFLRTLTRNSADADDIAQETFLAAWTQARRFRGESSVRSWLCAIAWRKAQGMHRSAFRRARRESAYHEMTPASSGGAGSADARIAVTEALAALPLDQRGAVALCLGCGFTHEEAAAALGLPLGTVKSHVARGRARMLSLLGEEP
jgi:RNA polymerase sigma-70 factor (ECF subfamily)